MQIRFYLFLIILYVFLPFANKVDAQQSVIDSLISAIEKEKEDTSKVNTLLEIAKIEFGIKSGFFS